MKNLSITLYMVTPVIPGKYPLNLDGLLYWSALEGSNEDESKAFDILNRALAQKDGVYQSSDMIYMQEPQNTITSQEAVFTTNFNWREFSYPLNKKSIMELGGPYRSRLTTYKSIGCDAVRFYAKGDKDIIQFLIESAGFIGRGNNQGHGEVSEVVIEEVDTDKSWYRVSEGRVVLSRCLPESVASAIPKLKEVVDTKAKTVIRVTPPYTKSQEHIGYSTSFKREFLD